jgi:hypothetical protein
MWMKVFLCRTAWLLLVVGAGYAQDVLRGTVTVDSEPVWVTLPGEGGTGQKGEYPLSQREIRLTALSAAIGYFSGMVYGWEYEYTVGEKARNLVDVFEWMPLGELSFGDVRMRPTDSACEGSVYRLWADYELDGAQAARRGTWLAGQIRAVHARGSTGLENEQQDALRDAAREAVRSLAHGSERERPKAVRGRIALAEFPVITIADGVWVASAKFFIEIREIQKYKGY